mmetsp:Transcript_37502/g.94262  ORF Transcript_37502/g.94262 Transcript_37502/m.94262 type:complete len:236 (-) Transcript_37502:712-1419(-)
MVSTPSCVRGALLSGDVRRRNCSSFISRTSACCWLFSSASCSARRDVGEFSPSMNARALSRRMTATSASSIIPTMSSRGMSRPTSGAPSRCSRMGACHGLRPSGCAAAAMAPAPGTALSSSSRRADGGRGDRAGLAATAASPGVVATVAPACCGPAPSSTASQAGLSTRRSICRAAAIAESLLSSLGTNLRGAVRRSMTTSACRSSCACATSSLPGSSTKPPACSPSSLPMPLPV